MSVSSSVSRAARGGRSRRFVIVAVLVAVMCAVAWAMTIYVGRSGTRSAKLGTATPSSMLSGLTPQQRQYVLGIVALTPAQFRAAFGTDWYYGHGFRSGH